MQGFTVPDSDRVQSGPQSLGRPILRRGVEPPKPRDPLDIRKDELDIKLKERDLAKGPDVAGNGEAKAAQSLSAGFYRRALYADALYNAKPQVKPRGALAQTALSLVPEAFVEENRSPQRREAENIADEFIRAKLRKESGAVISPEEMAKEYKVYFPVPGDTDEDFKRKAQFRKEAIAGLAVASGPLARSQRHAVAGDLYKRAADLRAGGKKGPAKKGGVRFLGFEE